MKKTLLSIGLASLFTTLAGSAMALEQRPILTLEVAKKMAVACEAKAKQEGWKMNIAIVDNGGNLKYFLRQDDAFLKSIEIAQLTRRAPRPASPSRPSRSARSPPRCRASHSYRAS